MAPIDPTFPLYPVACFLSAALLLVVPLTSFIRQSWNVGLMILCFWLFLENFTNGIDAIIWSDNADIKLYVYCDIVSHLQIITAVVKPMATLIITRKLYLIANLQSVKMPSQTAIYKDIAIEWIVGLLIPLLVAGPLYYIVQVLRFQVDEGFGCTNSTDGSILSILLLDSWSVIPPLLSVVIYFPRVARTFYRQGRDVNRFLQSNDSMSRTNYFRIMALAGVDVILTLPVGIVNVALSFSYASSSNTLPFYFGWTYDHLPGDWEPESVLHQAIVNEGTAAVAASYFVLWTSPVLAFVIFGLFGVTSEARASYWRIICTVGGWFGWKPTPPSRGDCSSLGEIVFGEQPAEGSMSSGSLRSQPTLIGPEARDREQDPDNRAERTSRKMGGVPEKTTLRELEAHQTSGDRTRARILTCGHDASSTTVIDSPSVV